jgi:hypothetical protein
MRLDRARDGNNNGRKMHFYRRIQRRKNIAARPGFHAIAIRM